jgi:starvation-inducible DNA-binding protein
MAVDEIAERIRALGVDAPGSYREFSALNSIDEAPEKRPAALDMASILAQDHEAVAKTARAALNVAEEAADEVSVDMMVERMTVHDKAAWMLRAISAE